MVRFLEVPDLELPQRVAHNGPQIFSRSLNFTHAENNDNTWQTVTNMFHVGLSFNDFQRFSTILEQIQLCSTWLDIDSANGLTAFSRRNLPCGMFQRGRRHFHHFLSTRNFMELWYFIKFRIEFTLLSFFWCLQELKKKLKKQHAWEKIQNTSQKSAVQNPHYTCLVLGAYII